MTSDEKVEKLEQFASYKTGCDNAFSDLLLEAAAHFRSLIPDANGLLPCPMCGPTSEATASGTFRGDHTVFCAACGLRIGHYCSRREAAEAWNRRGGIAAVVKPPSGQHVLGYIDFLEAWVVVHCDDAGMWRCAWDGEQLCDDVTYWQELPADPERKSRKMTMPEDRHTAEDRDDLAREQRRERRERDEYLTEEKETYGTTED